MSSFCALELVVSVVLGAYIIHITILPLQLSALNHTTIRSCRATDGGQNFVAIVIPIIN